MGVNKAGGRLAGGAHGFAPTLSEGRIPICYSTTVVGRRGLFGSSGVQRTEYLCNEHGAMNVKMTLARCDMDAGRLQAFRKTHGMTH